MESFNSRVIIEGSTVWLTVNLVLRVEDSREMESSTGQLRTFWFDANEPCNDRVISILH